MHANQATFEEICTRLKEAAKNSRILVAIAGPPGSGKSTFAQSLSSRLNKVDVGFSAVLSMDGYHFDNAYLIEQNWLTRKGAPFTFDVDGLRNMLSRLKTNRDAQIAVPVFDRDIEIARAGAQMIAKSVNLVLVEGNYLLLDEMPWASLHDYFDITIMLRTSLDTLRSRLQKRWLNLGMSDEEIAARLVGNDMKNACLVLEASSAADYDVINETHE